MPSNYGFQISSHFFNIQNHQSISVPFSLTIVYFLFYTNLKFINYQKIIIIDYIIIVIIFYLQ